jgi:hypothetical protein
MGLSVITNHQPRFTIPGYDLTAKELSEFDYYTEQELEEATFFRYKGNVYDLGEFMRCELQRRCQALLDGYDQPAWSRWDGYYSESAFSGVLIKFTPDSDSVIVARYMS